MEPVVNEGNAGGRVVVEVADDVVELVGIDGFSGDADRGDGLEAALEHLLRLLTPTTLL